ncbi:hypothetical protein PVAP13_9NG452000 [Panicum virgatum]|uniref:TFIIS N-terminal domain-containing protein n=1 Tax=Panicum virgatum TaxID=38727 RepID=A0A8T0MRI8_PANVG|nr:hypothetical protein PVAP13_9NG452000 [Panicum virgatum]
MAVLADPRPTRTQQQSPPPPPEERYNPPLPHPRSLHSHPPTIRRSRSPSHTPPRRSRSRARRRCRCRCRRHGGAEPAPPLEAILRGVRPGGRRDRGCRPGALPRRVPQREGRRRGAALRRPGGGRRPRGGAEELCVVLDGFMAESLLTLQAVPAEAVPGMLASSADLAKAVGSLRCHQSARVSGLARDVIRGWSAAIEEDIARTSAAMKKLDDLSRVKAADASHPLTNKTKPMAAGSHHPRTTEKAKAATATTIPESMPKTTPPFEEKMEATKRKLREGYRAVEDAKQKRKTKEIKPPKMLEQRQRKMHPILRERSQARCGSSRPVRRCLVSSFERV